MCKSNLNKNIYLQNKYNEVTGALSCIRLRRHFRSSDLTCEFGSRPSKNTQNDLIRRKLRVRRSQQCKTYPGEHMQAWTLDWTLKRCVKTTSFCTYCLLHKSYFTLTSFLAFAQIGNKTSCIVFFLFYTCGNESSIYKCRFEYATQTAPNRFLHD